MVVGSHILKCKTNLTLRNHALVTRDETAAYHIIPLFEYHMRYTILMLPGYHIIQRSIYLKPGYTTCSLQKWVILKFSLLPQPSCWTCQYNKGRSLSPPDHAITTGSCETWQKSVWRLFSMSLISVSLRRACRDKAEGPTVDYIHN